MAILAKVHHRCVGGKLEPLTPASHDLLRQFERRSRRWISRVSRNHSDGTSHFRLTAMCHASRRIANVDLGSVVSTGSQGRGRVHFQTLVNWSVPIATINLCGMGEHAAQQVTNHRRREHPKKQAAEAIARRLLDIVVYGKGCRIGDKLAINDLAETSEVGDWKMPDFRMACSYAASQGWLIIEGDTLTLTTAGLAAA